MLHLETAIKGRQMTFECVRKTLRNFGFDMGGNWRYFK